MSPDLVRAVQNAELPCVLINQESVAGLPTVRPDDVQAGRLLTEHLLELGHREIVFAFEHPISPQPHVSRALRWEGHVQAMRAAGLRPARIKYPNIDALVDFCLARKPRFTAI
ncbi:MAG TPA: hypothetical protein PKB10_11520, partial [Tepidisphaeraceae bacterium]|nr:hypothetical protein [Tepidisphaeraceae bacterium]